MATEEPGLRCPGVPRNWPRLCFLGCPCPPWLYWDAELWDWRRRDCCKIAVCPLRYMRANFLPTPPPTSRVASVSLRRLRLREAKRGVYEPVSPSHGVFLPPVPDAFRAALWGALA